MTKIMRARETMEEPGYNFYLEAGCRMLLDDVHLNEKIYVPGLGMTNVPFQKWIDGGLLIDEGESSIQMIVNNDINVGDGTTAWIEPMFNHLMWRCLEDKSEAGDGFPGDYLVGCEVGVHEGINAEKILRYLPVKKLYLIDPYDDNPEYQLGNPDLKSAKESARKLLEPYGDRVKWIYHTSEWALPRLWGLDFCYHDSDHRRQNVERELTLGYDTVRPGGYWGGHDYKNTVEGRCAVKSCVDEFVIQRNLSPLYYSSNMLNWWIIKP